MARPAPNAPQGDKDYGNGGEAPDERLAGPAGKRPAPKRGERPGRQPQPQTQRQGSARPESEPQSQAERQGGARQEAEPQPQVQRRGGIRQDNEPEPLALKQAEVRPESEPIDIPWREVAPPAAKDEPAAEVFTPPMPETRAYEPRSEPRPSPPPEPKPASPPDIIDAEWQDKVESEAAPAPAAQEKAANPPKAASHRDRDIAGTIYLVLLAILAASLSAAVVLFLF
jgi:hypothetical protein